MTVGQGPIVLALGAGGVCLDIFCLIYHFSFLSPSLWETARYRLKYCLKGPLNPKQPTNQLSPAAVMSGTLRVRTHYYIKKPKVFSFMTVTRIFLGVPIFKNFYSIPLCSCYHLYKGDKFSGNMLVTLMYSQWTLLSL